MIGMQEFIEIDRDFTYEQFQSNEFTEYIEALEEAEKFIKQKKNNSPYKELISLPVIAICFSLQNANKAAIISIIVGMLILFLYPLFVDLEKYKLIENIELKRQNLLKVK